MTLIKDGNSIVYGMGYKIAAAKVKEVLEHLDYREKNGYVRYETTFFPTDISEPKVQQRKICIVYVATEENLSFNRNHNLEDISVQIHNSIGPSGRNSEYLFNLCDAMREYFRNIYDDHLFELERLVRNLEAEDLRRKLIARRLSQEG